ncbi:MAG: leucine-rich repeat domain-containing protein [Tunicatimonas sp.]|uniref:leucine-rich repeat domain-containing protein n=1 Tax=Tunicatimonas sp. TaxID=1940096 RepID=UPI003C748E7B
MNKRITATLLSLWLSMVVCPILVAQSTGDELSPEVIAEYQEQSKELVSFLEYMMNFLGNPEATTQQKETIIAQSYLKAFRDEDVQVEDDLDEDRSVVTNKNVQAYLKDIDFFFEEATFDLSVDDVSYYVNNGKKFFRVTLSRNLQGTTVDGDTVNANQIRYVEINLNESAKDLKIASIYTTKLSEREELANWWSDVSEPWQKYFKAQVGAQDWDSANYRMLREIVRLDEINISGNQEVYNLEPLGKLIDLRYLDISDTQLGDLYPLRNLTKLESLNCSKTPVSDLSPLKYATSLREINCEYTSVDDLEVLTNFSKLEKLYCSHTYVHQLPALKGLKDLRCASTAITNIEPLAAMTSLVYLDVSETSISDLQPVASAASVTWLNLENTPVVDLEPLKALINLETLVINNTPVDNLESLNGLPKLQKVYCDNTPVKKPEANRFMAINPQVLVIYASEQMLDWWQALDPDWQQIFGKYVSLDTINKENLAQVANLSEIDISDHASVQTLEPLAALTNLKTLDCANTRIRDLTPLEGMVNLEHLNLAGTRVDSIGALSDARNLKVLNFDQTQVRSLLPLNNISGIQRLSCENTPIEPSKIRQFIREHPETIIIYKTDQLSLWWNALSPAWKKELQEQVVVGDVPDREQLHELAFLGSLTIEDNSQINSLAPLQEFVRLTELTLTGTRVADLSPLSDMYTLRALICARNPIRSLEPLSSLTDLVYLDFQNTPVEDLRPIRDLISLETLKCSGTQVDKLKHLSSLINLRQLECYNTDVKKLKHLRDLNQLQMLRCYNTRISDREVRKFRQANPDCEVVHY